MRNKMRKKMLALLVVLAMVGGVCTEITVSAQETEQEENSGNKTEETEDTGDSDNTDDTKPDLVGKGEIPDSELTWKEERYWQKGTDDTKTLIEDILTISGTGSIPVFQSELDVPWVHEYTDDDGKQVKYISVTKIILEDGVKGIDKSVFSNHKQLKTVEIKGDIENIEASAFSNCVSLNKVTAEKDISTIKDKGRCNMGWIKRV